MFRLNPLFTDGCVLCRRREIPVFGEAEDGTQITAALRAANGKLLAGDTRAARNGRFLLCLAPQEARTGCTLEIMCTPALSPTDDRAAFLHYALTNARAEEPSSCVVRDVAIGEVWLAGGQSNMELALMNADEGPAEVAAHDDGLLRFFDVPKWARACDEADEAFRNTRWQKALPGQAAWVSAVAYWFGRKARAHLNIPVGIIDCWWGGTSVTCWLSEETLASTAAGQRYLDEYAEKSAGVTMEAWLAAETVFRDGLDAWNQRVDEVKRELGQDAPWAEIEAQAGACPWNPPVGPGSQYRPHCLYDHMLRRIMPTGVNGFLWYQGEEDAARTDRYDLLMGQLIGAWRRDFGGADLPFLFVQLPGWGGCEDHEAWPRLRLQQAAVAKALRSTGLVVTLDVGDRDNIHPTNKRPVGERLYELARTVAWGEQGELSPEAVSVKRDPGALVIGLSAPLRPDQPLEGFEVCGADGVWHPAICRILGESLRLTCEAVPDPLHARYAFIDWPETVLKGKNGLPLAPFAL